MRRSMRRAGGFTLVEILVALGLAGLVVAAGLQMQATFNSQASRQEQINDLQQSLRLTMQALERGVRSGGSGMANDVMIMNTAGGPKPVYGVQYRNSNQWPWPGTYDSTGGSIDDTDPDQLKVIATEGVGLLALSDAAAGNVLTTSGPAAAAGITPITFVANDLFLVLNTPPLASCLREVTALTGGTTGTSVTSLTHGLGGTVHSGINLSPDPCLIGTTVYPAPVRKFRHETSYKVYPAVGTEPPKLGMRYADIGNVNAATIPWSLLAEGIEDMQIALLMVDGTVCADRDDPALPACDPSQVRGYRITLVARSSQKMAGAPPSQIGGYEDEVLTPIADGYLRRSLTSEIVLRN